VKSNPTHWVNVKTGHYREVKEYLESCREKGTPVRLNYYSYLYSKADDDYDSFLCELECQEEIEWNDQ
jgi:hypothetical protein